ncbi:MAG: ABC transporter permease, partial [Alphaproteobacteria bacterium]|nr:ABC transporter permease [Alphaproteobacteria bacterium]
YITAENLMKQVRLPLTAHVIRVVWRNLLILGHNAVILLVVAVIYARTSVLGVVSALIGVAVLSVTAVGAGLILGALCARFRDIPPLVANVMQIVFFVSPILWRPEVLGNRAWAAQVNPVFHFIEIVRAPIVSGAIPAVSWAVCVGAMLVSLAAAFVMLVKYRARVPYWV